MADAPAWFEDELPADAPHRRRRAAVLVALVAVSWIVLALVLVRGSGDVPAATADEGRDDDAGTRPPDEADVPGGTSADAAPPDALAAEGTDEAEAPGGVGAPIGRDAAEAVVVAVLRGWLSDGGPDLDIPGVDVDRRAYLEHVALEDFDVPSDEVAVARVLVVLLVRDDDHYRDAIVRRAAVPLTLTATGVHPGGEPWWLPTSPDLTPVAPTTTPASDDAVDEVAAALTSAGYRDVAVAQVATTEGGTLIADVAARTPQGDPVAGPVWLHPSASGLLVLGGPHTDTTEPADEGPPD